MTTGDQIRYLQHKEIDKAKWNACISQAPNGLIYAYSFYLDAMAKHWDALVFGDYEAVMPLTWNKKYGFYYLYQPAFTASLGVFGKNLTEMLVADFMVAIPSKFKLIEISLNGANIFSVPTGFPIHRSNYTLKLDKPHSELSKAYRDNHKRNINKALKSGFRVSKEVSIDVIMKLNEEQLKHIDGTKPEDYLNFKKLYELLKTKGQAQTYGIIDHKNKVLSSAVFFFSQNRAYYIMAGNHPEGKMVGASHALVDAFIKDHADQNIILDFEGSDMHSLAFFYEGFGAKWEIYPAIKINRLPWYVKAFKK